MAHIKKASELKEGDYVDMEDTGAVRLMSVTQLGDGVSIMWSNASGVSSKRLDENQAVIVHAAKDLSL